MSEIAGLVENAAGAGYVPVASVGDVPPGWILKVVAGGREVALANRDGRFYALDNSCTHAGGPLAHNRLSPDCTVECSWHNSLFDVRTGEVVSGPARKPAKTYQVQVSGGKVYVLVGTGRPPPVPAGPAPEASSDG
ncbi:MAG TPA: non-heme iron oxygenase ferredoxin subunit [Actinomycetota bacterium]|nr:non-heme iron oxygenase ferredoxin subunit [Actinomycetota bacterium]